MLRKIFKKQLKKEVEERPSLDKLSEALTLLDKKEQLFLRKIDEEVEKAKGFSKTKNKRAALQCLKKKKLYEQQVEQLGNFQLRIHDQMILLESAAATTETVGALRSGAAAMKAIQKATKIDDLEDAVAEINDQVGEMKQIQEALSAPIGLAADFDDDELLDELNDLELHDEDEQLVQSEKSPLQFYFPSVTPQQTERESQQTEREREEEEELAALQADMAL